MMKRQTKRAKEDLLEEMALVNQSENLVKESFIFISTMAGFLCAVFYPPTQGPRVLPVDEYAEGG
jgi:hypothetical protein